jgi:lysophospholipase L1-like esterase
MKLNIFLLVLIVIACTGSIAVATEHVDASVKIMPLGDSITRGGGDASSPYPSYRYYLWNILRNGGYDVDFVGSTTDPGFTSFVFDQDHDGYSGYTTEELANDMDRILALNIPDIVLLDIGTNDLIQQVPMSDRMRNLDRIVSKLRQKNPNVRIAIAQISPTADTFRNAQSGLDEYNEKVLAYGKGATTAASPIVVADMSTAWSTAQFTQADGIHPNNEGESLLAQRWANALIATGMIAASVPTQTPVSAAPTTMPTPAQTTVVTTAPTANPSPAATVTAALPSGGKHYAIGNPGSYLGTAFGGTGTATGSGGSSTGVTTGSTLKPGSVATGITPPTTKFVRWYPAARWATGVR